MWGNVPQIGPPIHEVFLATGVIFLSASAVVGIHLWQNVRDTPISVTLLALIGGILAFTGHLATHLINRLDSMKLLGVEMTFRVLGLVLLLVFLLTTATILNRTSNRDENHV